MYSSATSSERCDVLNDDEIAKFCARFQNNPSDVLVHAIAFAPNELFTEPASAAGAEAFCRSLTVSAHSLCKVARFAKPNLREWGSVLTLTYQGSNVQRLPTA